ncbi:MAG TPA: O-methyltransferase [Lysinibacillus sp.]|uniref:O-methyltransferase n=1 Tax=Lysinibacillus fusiformis TaxID=28031 RepID=A0A2I0UW76_9BACI|nr:MULTISPECIES: O-methyltransferase [Lysinibacillus]HBT73519.1 O-methyltransferase [Lysinibacillus sp.]KUF35616.1 methyltransferase [Lysinibacillus sp. F5]MEE3808941.1 O-methyltransferase [Lysinibacillus fusiformis]PKU50256.1 O-methyltransferase [Lysinibacillus fusiformis]WCH47937.1 O-methyltransferase [Lysinibacillus sp. OF-1]
MTELNVWKNVDDYFMDKLLPENEHLDAVLQANKEAGIPEIDVSPTQGKLLYLLAKIKGAATILEIGTLGGYSSICLAQALPKEGKVVTLEINEEYALVAQQNIERAGYKEQVEIILGNALDSLPNLKKAGHLFDFIFIDADKPNNPAYLKWALKLAHPGAIIIADNVVRNGAVTDEISEDERVRGVQQFIDLLKEEPRIEATAIQTVGVKGYDGFVLAIVN